MTPTNMDDRPDTRDTFERAVERLRKDVVPVEDDARVAARKERLVPALAAFAGGEFERRRSRVRWKRTGAAAGAIAAAAAVALFLRGAAPAGTAGSAVPAATVVAAEGTVQVGHPGSSAVSAATAAMPLGGADRVHTDEGTAEVSLRTGAVVQLSPHTQLELGAADQRQAHGPSRDDAALDERVRLSSGSIQVRVPRLRRGSLMVSTPHAAVTVHGTVFRVDVRAADGATPAHTIVSVTEGKVSVASGGREIFLTPGATWSSAIDAAAALSDVHDAGAARAGGTRAAKPSTLREENELFRAVLEAKRAGDSGRTVELVDELLRRYPATPLRGAASRERTRAEALLRAKPSSP